MLWMLMGCAGCSGVAGDTGFVSVDTCDEEALCSTDEVVVTAEAVRSDMVVVDVPRGASWLAVGDAMAVGTKQIYVGTNQTVTRVSGADWADVTDIWTQAEDGTRPVPLVADVTGDGVDDLVVGLPGGDGGAGQVLVRPGPVDGTTLHPR